MRLPLVFLAILSTLAPSPAAAEPRTRGEFFDSRKMFYVRITGWNGDWMTPQALEEPRKVEGARLEVFETDPASALHCPDAIATPSTRLFGADGFSLRTSGNKTLGTPKSSYKVKLAKKGEKLFGMSVLNLKSMWNDVSQMREALAWNLFKEARVPASGHTYAKFCINGRYYGLYSVIEEVERSGGNLYKAYWEPADIGPATLEYRSSGGDDSGRQYFRNADPDKRTYRPKDESSDYEDLAALARQLEMAPDRMDEVLDVRAFLRWAAVNVLIGAWDNYWATPANYYLHNAGTGAEPRFSWIPWDYDNSFGISYWSTQWQTVDLIDWEASTRTYHGGQKTSKLPMISRLLKVKPYLRYYLDRVEDLLDGPLSPAAIERDTARLWEHVRTAAFLESDTPAGRPHTGRQFTNDQVYWNGAQGRYFEQGGMKTFGIREYVRARGESARNQLRALRREHPRGSGGR